MSPRAAKSPRKKAKARSSKPKTVDPTRLERIVLLLISGVSTIDAESYIRTEHNVSQAQAAAEVAEARRRIKLTAQYDRTEQTGKAIRTLEDLYSRAIKGNDIKTALATRKELNRLLRLYEPTPAVDEAGSDDADAESAVAELDAIRAHLLPLKLAPDNYPLREVTRIAADIVRQTRPPSG